MRVLNDFRCDKCGTTKEYFLDNNARYVDCLDCGGVAEKVRAVPNFHLPGNDPAGFPTAADKWVKKREQKMREEAKTDNS